MVLFTWLAPPAIQQNGVIQYYQFRLRELNTGIFWTFYVVDEDINIASLHPYYNYECTAAAHTSVGSGPFSNALSIETDEAGVFYPY